MTTFKKVINQILNWMAIQILILKTKKILFNFISVHLQRHFHNSALQNTKQKKKNHLELPDILLILTFPYPG